MDMKLMRIGIDEAKSYGKCRLRHFKAYMRNIKIQKPVLQQRKSIGF